jgi:probable selenium-dependent hydroxylase accessory protein YqeC
MPSLSAWFDHLLNAGSRNKTVTVIGSGGKTSLIWHLAVSLAKPGCKILVTPATKMFVPPAEEKLYDRYCNCSCKCKCKCDTAMPGGLLPGVTLAGVFNETSGKLESLPPETLEKIIAGYDLVLMEGDGSRGLPLKAWADGEPVVPLFTSITVGIAPLWPLGKPVSEETAHRLPLFLALVGASKGEIIKPEHYARVIMGRQAAAGKPAIPGLFAKARGSKVLFFNQIEDYGAIKQAEEIVSLLPGQFRESLSGIIAGSVRSGTVREL